MTTSTLIIRVNSSGVENADAALRRLAAAGGAAQGSVIRLSSSFNQAHNSANGLASVTSRLDAAFAGLIGVGTIKSVTELSDTWTILTNKLELAKKANEDVAQVQERVFAIAQRTRTDLSATATLYARLERATKSSGISAQELGRTVETISKAMIISGATSNEAAAAMQQFSQAMASGVLRGDEFRSVAEQAPRVTQILMDSLGMTIGELRKMAYSGKLTADIVMKAMGDAASVIDTEFGRTMPTFNQQMTIATNNVTRFFGESERGRAVVMSLGQGLVALSENLGTIATVAGGLATIFTARLITALSAKALASARAAQADRQQALVMAELQRVTASAVGVTAQRTAGERAAALAAKQLAAAEAGVARGTASATTARLALAQATLVHRNAVLADIQANTALTTALNTAAAAAGRASVVMGMLRGTLGLLGGPLGVAMLAAGAVFYLKQAHEASVQSAVDYANSVDKVTAALENMTQAELAATRVRAAEAVKTLTEEYADAAKEQKRWTDAITYHTEKLASGKLTIAQTAEANDRLKNAQNQLALAAEYAEGKQTELAKAQTLLQNAMVALSPVVVYMRDMLMTLGNVSVAPKVNLDFLKELKESGDKANQTLEETKLKASGAVDSAYVYSQLLNAAGKSATEYNDQLYKVATGQINAANAADDTEKALVALGGTYRENFKLNESLKETKKEFKAAATELKNNTTVMDDYRDKVAQANVEINNNARQAAILTAQNKLSKDATVAMKTEVGELAAKYYDLTEAIKKKNEQEANRKGAQADITSVMDPMMKVTVEADERIRELELQQKTARVQDYQLFEDAKTAVIINAEKQRHEIQKASAALGEQTIQDSFGVMVDMAKVFAGEQSGIYKVMFALQKAFAVAQILTATELAAAQIMAHDAGIMGMGALASANLVRTMGYASAGMVAGMALTGMAHDGIDKVPEEGTWLLQKGERVLSARQNADFGKFMQSGGSQSSGGSGGGAVTIIQNITISGIGDEALQQQLARAASDGAEQGYNRVVQDVATRGDIRKMLTG